MYLDSTEFKELKSIISYICSITKDISKKTFEAYINKDIKKAENIKDKSRELENYSFMVDELSGKIIALYWPRGSDMRFITSTIKISADFKRIGEHCKKIAKQVIKLENSNFDNNFKSINELFENVVHIVSLACTAYYNLDIDISQEIIKNDNKIDSLKSLSLKDIIQFMMNNNSITDIKTGINLINIARRLERIADHTVNIAEVVYYITKGLHIDKDNIDETCFSN